MEPGGSSVSGDKTMHHSFEAVAFDYFVLFNPDSVVAAVERIMPGQRREFSNLADRQFKSSWLRSISDRYVDFFAIS